jgi:hypothetical protein
MVLSCSAPTFGDVTVRPPPGRTRVLPVVAEPDGGRARRFARRHSVQLACLATLALHLMTLTRQLGVDEGGFAMVARYAGSGGSYLYGPSWVDRPPGLLAVFVVAERLGPFGVRAVAAALAVVLVAATAAAADALGGRSSARWAAWAAFALSSSVLLQAHRLNGELAAAAFVAVSVAAVVHAVRTSPTRAGTLVAGTVAGAAAMCAVLTKQNFLDGFVFAGVLLGLGSLTRVNRLAYRPVQVVTTAGAFVAGAAVPAALTVRWAGSHGGLGALMYATFGFRGDAVGVVAHSSSHAPLQRLGGLALLGCLTGLLFLLGQLAVAHHRRLRHLEPLPWAVAATVGVELLGVAAGENFWSHYLTALTPMVALAAGLGVHQRMSSAPWTRRLVVLMACSTALVSPVAAVHAVLSPSRAYTTGRWIAASAHPHDTLSVLWTHANVIDASGLRPGYPYAWSLPLRTLDPQVRLLVDTLDEAPGPTWVVRWDSAHPWGLDPGNRVDGALHAHYRDVATVCGHQIWLHDGAGRHLAAPPSASACGGGAF